VASLAEAAAEEVGANATLCRVCSYFHDIGKLKKPTYFIENQGEENPHDSITPSMSALVIIAHVKDGVDLAIKHKLNPVIVDVIREHHGDSLVYYFYHKAREARNEAQEKADQGLINPEDVPEVDEKNFRYAGPRPRTPESGIISLADCVESASRTLTKPTPAKIESLVNDIVNKRIAEGQMDDCGLTLSDLKKIRESFAKTIRSILHSRINYPKEEDRKNDAELRAAGRPSSLQRKVEEPIEKRKSGKQTVKQTVKSA
jgi:putative nucleotidyltransferase with HDIG domain